MSDSDQTYDFKSFWLTNLPTRNLFLIILIVYIILSIFNIIRVDVTNLRDVFTISVDLLAIVGQNNLRVFNGHIYLILTSIFVHSNIIHFISNCLFLFIFGLRAEERFFSWQYYTIFIVSGLLGGILSFVFGPYSISVGASGGIFGLLGADLILAYEENKRKSLWAHLGAGVIFLAITGGVNVNSLAHGIGLLSGIVLPYFFLKRRKTEGRGKSDNSLNLTQKNRKA
ncbi:MAG: rhomboid family intramembrane serine protease [Candidatus Heimdallarchaeota archaeon]